MKAFVRTTVTVALTGMLVCATPALSFATPAQSTLQSKQAEATQARLRLDELSRSMETAGEDLASAQANLAQTKQEIKKAEGDISAAKDKLHAAQKNLSEQINTSYRAGNGSYFQVFFGARSFQDFVTQFSYLQMISSQKKEAIDAVSAAQTELETKQASLKQREREQEELEAAAKSNQAQVSSTLDQQQQLLNSLNGEVKQLIEDQRAQLEAQRKSDSPQVTPNAGTQGGGSSPERSDQGGSPGGGARDPEPGGAPSPGGGTPTPKPQPKPSPDTKPSKGAHPEVIPVAKRYIGVPYVWGGTTPKGFDCSGLTQYSYRQIGITIPRTSRQQYSGLSKVGANNLMPGDLIFFGNGGSPSSIYHVGIYLGGGSYIHAPQPGDSVKISYGLFSSPDFVGGARP